MMDSAGDRRRLLTFACDAVNNANAEDSVKTCRDTVLKLREHVLGRNPNSGMVFAATSADHCWFIAPGESEYQHVRIHKDFTVEDLLEKLIVLAGTAALLIQMHAKAKRCISWWHALRGVSHLVNGLGARVQLADYAQGNGRGCAAMGKRLLQQTGRDYVVPHKTGGARIGSGC